MAVILTTEPQGELLNVYNNSILEFTTDVGTPARATVEIGDYKFNITPNKNVFYINLKEIIAVIVNQDVFDDPVEIVNPLNYLFPDANLYKEIEFTITVIKTNSTSETLTKTYKFIKSATQIVRKIYDDNDLLKILSPTDDAVRNVTYFEGYPFDVSIYSNIARTVTVTHKRTASTLDITLSKGVNRLFLSNGENDNYGFEEALPLYTGVNELEFKVDNSNIIRLFVTKKPVSCGKYLKWFNQSGAWSYWLFSPIHKEGVNPKSLGEINRDFKNIEDTFNRVTQIGKTAFKEFSLDTGYMTDFEKKIVSEVYTSPKVYLYNNQELQPFAKVDFKEVEVTNGYTDLISEKQHISQKQVNIKLPELYTQTYAS